MKKILLMLVVLIFTGQSYSIVEESGSLNDFILGDEPDAAYSNWISHIVEGIASEGYNMYAPYDRQTDGFGQFTLPSDQERATWEQALDLFFQQQYSQAHNLLMQSNIPYSVVKFTDGANIYYMLREDLNSTYIDDNGSTLSYDDEIGSFDYGWGLYIYRQTSPNPIIVTTPHPNDDFISPFLSVKTFLELNAQYLMINGSGREVMWNEYGSYANNKSISDPTRNHDHPFNYFYEKACDKIREDFDRRELSIQLHSYDWDSHPDMASCQVSPGQYNRPAGLPIRDFSSLRQDLIQETDYIVVPQGTIGNNEEVTIHDYYSVHKYFYPTVYHDTLIISADVDLPGYANSFQDIYSTENFSDWDVFSPFFHVEFDELPNCYPQSDESFKSFYGYNSYTNNWNISQRFSKLEDYYQPFSDALNSSVSDWNDFDDNLNPEAPTNLRRFYGGSGNSIAWDVSPCYDFYSYEILYSLDPISQNNYEIVNRQELEKLAFPLVNNISLPDLEINQTYYIAMRTLDYNGNVSDLSQEIVYNTLPIVTSEFDIYADNTSISFDWSMTQQQNCLGFEIHRKVNDSEFELYSSYEDNPDLEINTTFTQFFSFTDTNVEAENNYAYIIYVVNTAGTSGQISQVMQAALADYIQLASSGQAWDKSITFGKSYYASSSYDEVYDVLNDASENYLAINADNQSLLRNIIEDFEADNQVRYFDLVIDNPPNNVTFSINDNRFSERFYLEYENQLYSLDDGDISLDFPEEGAYNLRLIWGNLQAQVSFPELASGIVYQGNQIEFSWAIDYPELVEGIDLYLTNERDTIYVAQSLPPVQTQFTYLNDNDQNYRMMNLFVATHTTDGEIKNFKAYSRFVLIAEVPEMTLTSQMSNTLFSYPFANDLDISAFTDNIQAFSLLEDEFTPTDNLNQNSGYLINIAQDQNLQFTGQPLLDDTQYPLNQEWNLITNPHPIDYLIDDLLFEVNGRVRSFNYVANSQMIYPTIIGVKNGAYTVIDTLKAFSSAFLYQASSSTLNLRFSPINVNEKYAHQHSEVYFTLEFKTSTGASDEFTVGMQEGLTPGIDINYDMMKPPLRPVTGLREAAVLAQPPISTYFPKFHKQTLELTENDTYQWDITFTNSLDQAVQVRIKESQNPDNYPIDLVYAGNEIRLTNNFQVIPNTQESGEHEAELIITTITNNSQNDVAPLVQVFISPNPISQQANIFIPNTKSKDFSLAIYNLKGQKVKEFKFVDCKDENSSIKWNLTNKSGKRVSSGVYFVRYKDSATKSLRKICIIK